MNGASTFYPDPTPCWRCRWYYDLTDGGAICLNPLCAAKRSTPSGGCVQWVQQPGQETAGPPETYVIITNALRRDVFRRRGEEYPGDLEQCD